MQILFTDRPLPTVRCMGQIGARGGGGGAYIALYTENYCSLCIYLVVQIPPFIDWTCSAMCAREKCGDDNEFASRFRAE